MNLAAGKERENAAGKSAPARHNVTAEKMDRQGGKYLAHETLRARKSGVRSETRVWGATLERAPALVHLEHPQTAM